MLKNKTKFLSWIGLVGIAGVSLVFALGSGYPFKSWQIFGLGAFRNTPQFYTAVPSAGASTHFYPGTDNTNDLGSSSLGFRTIYTYDLTMQDDLQLNSANSQVQFGATTSVSSTVVLGASQGTLYLAQLGGGVASAEGSAMVATSTSGTNITVMVAQGSALNTAFVGIASGVVSTGSVVGVFDTGWVNALTVGAVSAGDQVYISSVPGYLSTLNFTTGPVCGIALQAASNVFGGITKIRVK